MKSYHLFSKVKYLFVNNKSYKAGSKDIIKLTSVVVGVFGVTISLIVLLSIDMSRYSVLINQTGKIRGGIQRLVKLELNKIHDEALLMRIDNLLIDAKKLNKKRLVKITKNQEYDTLLNILDDKWELLKREISDFNNGIVSSDVLIKDSEALWVVSNDVVSSMESISHFNVFLYYIIAVISSFGVFSLFFVLFITKHYVRDKIEYLAQHDQLTGLANRHYFNDIYEREYSIAVRNNRIFSILLCDIDHFKIINDKFGHAAGDNVLKEIAKLLQKESRESDVVARFGGEEFIILSIEEVKDNAIAFGDRIRKSVENLLIIQNHKITISIGISMFKKDISMNELVQEADRALYKAKESGRNRVCSYE
jgi:diguanylate cyclase (GGDEF)-like protein